jgi:hypothetical protein
VAIRRKAEQVGQSGNKQNYLFIAKLIERLVKDV